jgi:hypothetical protein
MPLACRDAGLPPLALVEGYVDGGATGLFEVAGALDDLFNVPAVS